MFFAVWLGPLMVRPVVEKMGWRAQFTHPARINPVGTLHYAPAAPDAEIWPRKRKNSSGIEESGDASPSRRSKADAEIVEKWWVL